MRLYFMRHGPAGSHADWRGDDADRPLTADGSASVALVAEKLVAAGVGACIDRVLTSPYLRAHQTAQIAADSLGLDDALASDPRLAPGFGLAELMGLLADNAESPGLLLVGHEPDFSTVISRLIGGGRLEMKKSSVALVEMRDPRQAEGTLRWLVPPKIARL